MTAVISDHVKMFNDGAELALTTAFRIQHNGGTDYIPGMRFDISGNGVAPEAKVSLNLSKPGTPGINLN